MEVSHLIRLFRKWFWLIILAAAVGAGITILTSVNRTFTYQAQTKVLIGGFIGSSNPNRGEIETGAVLAETYVEIVNTPLVLQGVIDTLGLDMTVSELKPLVLAGKPGDPPILVIQAFYNDPETAIRIANEAARQLILNSPTNLTPAQQAQIDLSDEQINALNEQVQDARLELEAIDERMNAAGESTAQNSALAQQRRALIDQINQATTNIAQFSAIKAGVEQQTNRMEIIEEATEAPFFRTGPGLLESTVLSALTGVVLAIVGILAIDYVDNSIKTSKDATATLSLPVLGTIPTLGKRGDPYPKKLLTNWSSRSAVAESYRTLQTNLISPADLGEDKALVITSPNEGEGKSVTAANLAVTMALNGLQVLLVDADLVQPRIHEIFQLDNEYGIKNLISMTPSEIDSEDTLKPATQMDAGAQKTLNMLNMCVKTTHIENLRVITSGPITETSTHLSEYSTLQGWIEVFHHVLGVDVVLFDTPPCLVMSDASIVASMVHADCVLVVQSGRTRSDAAVRAKTQFAHTGVELVGVVLNRVKAYDVDHGYNSGYVKNYQPADMREMLINMPYNAERRSANGTVPERTLKNTSDE
ncbi:MAG: P-loop NTPase [Anaerolineae bacterium]|nr:P-loop NTPase [Anaerolineae bacterium]